MTQKKRFYPLAECSGIDHATRQALGNGLIMAVLTGEKRQPLQGEWFLSGAIPEAYRAFNDLAEEYLIVRLVRVKTRTIIEVDDG